MPGSPSLVRRRQLALAAWWVTAAACAFEATGAGSTTSGSSESTAATQGPGSTSADSGGPDSASATTAETGSSSDGVDESSTGGGSCSRAWTIVDDFRLEPTQGADPRGVMVMPDGTVAVAGGAIGSDGLQRWVVRRGTDDGTWETIDDWQPIAGRNAYASSPLVVAGDELLVVGGAQGDVNPAVFQWRARRSDDGGGSWSDSDIFQLAMGLDAGAERVATDGTTVWSVGHATRMNGTVEWHARRSADDGALGTWTDSDAFVLASNEMSIGVAVAVTGRGDAFAAGYGFDGGVPHWIVRSSLGGGPWTTAEEIPGGAARDVVEAPDGSIYAAGSVGVWAVRRSWDLGETWETVDIFQLEIAKQSEARAMLVDPRGLVAVFGIAVDALDRTHAVVRSSEDAGATWQTIDDYLYEDELAVIPRGLAQDATGDVYLSVTATDVDGRARWLVRRASCR